MLKQKHIQVIKNNIPEFINYLNSKDGKRAKEERDERVAYFRSIFGKENIDDLSEDEFRKAIKILWANEIWSNKDYLVDKILNSTPFDEIKQLLKNLLWGKEPLKDRYDKFIRTVKYMGTAQITEIMCFTEPEEYAIWNRRVMNALDYLEFGDILPVNKYYPSGREYEKINKAMKEIAEVLKSEGITPVDLTIVDLFLWIIEANVIQESRRIKTEKTYDHNEIIETLVAVGNNLGFEANKEVPIARGARVDVVWSSRIGNLGVMKYVFEVHLRGSIDSLILNLQKAKRQPQVQKVIVVSTPEEIKKISEEIKDVSEDFAKHVSYLEIEDVIKARDLLKELSKILSKLELT